MNGGLSPSARDLLRAAKADAPAASTRAEMWKGIEQSVTSATATAATAATATAAATTGTAATSTAAAGTGTGVGALASVGGSAKAAFVGALIGSAASVAVVALVLHFSAATLGPSEPAALARHGAVAGERFDAPSALMPLGSAATRSDDLEIVPGPSELGVVPGSTTRTGLATTGASPSPPLGEREREDILSREASLVTSARRHLLAGEASAALSDVHAARALPLRQLEPELLTLEARALRSLGRDDEAGKAEMTLRLRYPSQAPRPR